jgi:peptidoglycan LD-endopeptidase LytH
VRRRRVAVALAALLLLGAPAGSVAQSLDEAREQRQTLQERLDAAATQLGEIEQVIAEIETERDELAGRADVLESELEELDELMAVRVRSVFKHGTALDPVAVFLASDDPQEALSKASTVHRLVRGDQVDSEGVVASRTQLASVSDRLEQRRGDLDEALAEQQRLAQTLERDLARAQELEERLVEEERERQRERERERRAAERAAAREAERASEREAAREAERAEEAEEAEQADTGGGSTGSGDPAPASGSGGMVCPVDQPRSFTDTWGAPRSGGRAHRGTDILAPMGTPVRAITDGVWDIQSPGPNAGLWAILRGSDGTDYWYLHLQSHTVSDGARVSAGQQTGTNGDTGNARGTPHVHFEMHPGGGGAINPYPTLRRVCG